MRHEMGVEDRQRRPGTQLWPCARDSQRLDESKVEFVVVAGAEDEWDDGETMKDDERDLQGRQPVWPLASIFLRILITPNGGIAHRLSWLFSHCQADPKVGFNTSSRLLLQLRYVCRRMFCFSVFHRVRMRRKELI